jgi:hypothetical protein
MDRFQSRGLQTSSKFQLAEREYANIVRIRRA